MFHRIVAAAIVGEKITLVLCVALCEFLMKPTRVGAGGGVGAVKIGASGVTDKDFDVHLWYLYVSHSMVTT